jgi:hypothetical protein
MIFQTAIPDRYSFNVREMRGSLSFMRMDDLALSLFASKGHQNPLKRDAD